MVFITSSKPLHLLFLLTMIRLVNDVVGVPNATLYHYVEDQKFDASGCICACAAFFVLFDALICAEPGVHLLCMKYCDYLNC